MSNKDHLIVIKNGQDMIDATICMNTIPADEVGPAHKKYYYCLSDGMRISYGFTKREALEMLLDISREQSWRVLQPLT